MRAAVGPGRGWLGPLLAAAVAALASASASAQKLTLDELVSAVVRIKTFINPDGAHGGEPRPRARRLRHRHRRERAGPDHRLSHGRGARRRGRSPTTAAPCRPTSSATTTRPASACCGRSRRSSSSRSRSASRPTSRSSDPVLVASFGGARHGGARPRGRQARVRRQLGISARRRDLHGAAASGLERRRADQPRGQARRRRLADRRRRHRQGRRRRPATCSCRSICCRRSWPT